MSTEKQSLNAQLGALEREGCEKVFAGKQSGAREQNERMLDELVDYVREDVVIVTKLDAWGARSSRSLTPSRRFTPKAAQNARRSDRHQRYTLWPHNAESDWHLRQLERDIIADRAREGQLRAMAEGKAFGRPRIPNETRKAIASEIASGKSIKSTATKYEVGRATAQRIAKEYGVESRH